jgi:quinoprotein glucose dehydrogenase
VTKPAPFEHQGITEDDLIDFTPELRAEALEIAKRFRMGPLFNPPSLADASDGTGGAFSVPGAWGGANIPGGASVDPETGMLYVATVRGSSVYAMVPGEAQGSNAGYVSKSGAGARVQGLPLLKPPWTSIVAIDMNTGEHAWRIPNGDTPEDVKNHPALQGVDIPKTGNKGSHATILSTKSLLIYGEGRGAAPFLHAVNKKTGEEIARIELPAPTNTAPMTFMHEGKQYIVLSVAGRGYPAEHVALALPD